MSRENYYAMTSPCPQCPFRNDIEPYIRPGRVREIEQSLQRSEFTCHKTTVDSEDDDSERVDGPHARHCAGALIILEKNEDSSQMTRIAERLGMYDPSKLNLNAPVYDSFEEMYDTHVDLMGDDEDEYDEES